ncbi:MAG: arsenate reductase [Gammaproteobacteria bacterium]|nr:MAG: arsenate reductase [Gammaproteobacteria bacterium]
MTIIYGINNCDTVKKALQWLNINDIDIEFFDFKKQMLTEQLIKQFVDLSSWDKLINKRSTTFRNLPAEVKNNLTDDIAVKTVLAQPTLLKRPLLLHHKKLHLGFKETQYQEIFSS